MKINTLFVKEYSWNWVFSEATKNAKRCPDKKVIAKYTVSQKNDTDVTHYRFNPHQPISVIFGRDVAERVCY